ncbi:MAG: hypothetical protein MJ247_03340 [Alphaproteobacteria bacterium]|nr:hypothetical protein [Alphaproteobacteria bacterium]
MLQDVFLDKKEQKNQARMNDLIERVCDASKTGKTLLEDAKAHDVKFLFSDSLGCVDGCYKADKNTILINEDRPDEQLLTTLVHEARHAQQKVFAYEPENSLYSAVAITRAKEADATAYQCAAAFEMRGLELDAYLDFAQLNPEIMDAYVDYAKDNKDKALCEAFKHWYDTDVTLQTYDSRVLTCLEFGDFGGNKDVKNTDLCKNIAPYMDPEFFNSKEALTISDKTEKRVRDFEEKSGKKVSTSRFYIDKGNGVVKNPENNVGLRKKISQMVQR